MAKKAAALKSGAKRDVPAWKAFEQAVAAFIRTLDPKATVHENAKLPDVDTGRSRQRDVIVHATVCQQFPVTMLVSCKLKGRPLSEEDIDHFVGEMRSTSAPMGVIYAKRFSSPALEKARKLGISCCKLFQNEPAEVPQQIILRHYHCRPTFRISLSSPIDDAWQLKTWGDLFAIEATYNDNRVAAIDAIAEVAFAKQKPTATPFPVPWADGLSLSNGNEETVRPLNISIFGKWRYWESKVEAYLLNGSYSLTTQKFIGAQVGPVIDTWSTEPGEGWTELPELPEGITSGLVSIAYKSTADIKSALTEVLAELPILRVEIDGGTAQA